MNINVIVSYADDLIIGNDEDIQWSVEYLTYFEQIINNHSENKKNIIIIGNKTYNMNNNNNNSIIEILKKFIKNGDIILIVIKNLIKNLKDTIESENGVYMVDSLGKCMELCKDFYNDGNIDNIFIAGGESIYTYYLTSYYYKLLNKVYITRIHRKISGNKKFYGLEDKFYYLSIDKSSTDIEHRVLQYDNDFRNGETLFLNFIRKTLKSYDNYGYSNKGYTFEIDIDLTKYFPVYSIIKPNIKNIFTQLFASIKKEENLKEIHDTLISISLNEKNSYELNFNDINPFNSKYEFHRNEFHKLSCNVVHKTGNILNEVIMNIIFSSLIIHLFCYLTGLEPETIHYKCIETTYLEKQVSYMEKIAWNTPDVLSLIRIKNRKQKDIEDFCEDDIELLGVNI